MHNVRLAFSNMNAYECILNLIANDAKEFLKFKQFESMLDKFAFNFFF